MLNRDLLIVRYRQPFVDWVNEADPHPAGGAHITLESAKEDSSVFLIHEFASEEFETWLESCYQPLFDNILGSGIQILRSGLRIAHWSSSRLGVPWRYTAWF